MRVRRFVAVVALIIMIVATVHCGAGHSLAVVWDPSQITLPRHVPSVGMKKFVNSFTSYQFANPFPPQQDPLSRLEFPIDQWFLGLKDGYAAQSWSVTGQAWINVTRESNLKMQDSDWDDDVFLSQKTIFSESGCRLNRGVIVEAGVTLPTPYHLVRLLKPVTGLRYQYFFFTTHDGYQAVLGDRSATLSGDGIDFKQTFYQAYFGANLTTGLDLAFVSVSLPRAVVDLQVDYAFVSARNEDMHLLREGNRLTTENTTGHCWHLCASLGLVRGANFNARFEADFKRLITHGDHKLSNLALDLSFDGARVWSDQTSLTCWGEYIF